jgi:hypothetical protein
MPCGTTMRLTTDILENPDRRPYHIVVGIIMLTAILTAIAAGVRATLG